MLLNALDISRKRQAVFCLALILVTISLTKLVAADVVELCLMKPN
jgi:hypothetical protein